MFKFEFDIEGESSEDQTQIVNEAANSEATEHPFGELQWKTSQMRDLPDDISYSSVRIGDMVIPRRDLFDVRMQLMALESLGDAEVRFTQLGGKDALEYASRPCDLVPRVYEGGLKTWECSLDLASYVESNIKELRGKRILELGCGTAMPTLAILQKLFDSPIATETVIHIQDYNPWVLEYVTLPNIILVWFFSKAGKAYRDTIPPPSPKPTKSKPNSHILESVPEEDEDMEAQPPIFEPHTFDPNEPGDLALTPGLRSAFLESLEEHRIRIHMFSGPWSGFENNAHYDLVLTSETIYQPSSLGSLVGLLQRATDPCGICLVAAKLVYFGVGGGVGEFEQVLKTRGGQMRSVWKHREGVGRCILQVEFRKE